MTKGLNAVMLTAQLGTADCAVNDHIVTTDLSTGGINMILFHGICGCVSMRGYNLSFKVIASATITSVFALCRTSGCNRLIPLAHIMAKSLDIVMIATKFSAANSAVNDHVVAANCGTGGINMIFFHRFSRRMSVSGYYLGFKVITTRAIMSVFTLCCTSGSNRLIPLAHVVT